MVCELVVALLLLFSFHHEAAQRQAVAVDRIERAHGTAMYPFNKGENRVYRRELAPSVPHQLVGLFGVDFFYPVTWVELDSPKADDETMQAVASLPSVRQLHLSNLSLDEHSFSYVGRLQNLEWVTFIHAGLNDEDLRHLEGLRKLRKVWIVDERVSDPGLKVLLRNKSVSVLYLSGTDITEAMIDEAVNSRPGLMVDYWNH